ncbi:MAG: 2-C-methyl-D-erythritol 2,4-cyclodiphosphate synthase [Oscillospiraceae bacterium]|nr:2-C-methyl-D-erythritol 2,4-cyclodiphosphate synthase [Oscillospiraceae bacterium]
MRIGHGYDAHRLKKGRRCVLCGVTIPCEFGPDGHSDADVPVHALMDAMLGALALGDIGTHFPSSDNKWKDADSMKLLCEVDYMIKAEGYTVGNADITIVLQEPKLAAYIIQMREKIAQVLQTDIKNISIKATTEEGLGFTGDKSGISATAVVFLTKIQ